MTTFRRILLLKADHQPSPAHLAAAVRLATLTDAKLSFADLVPDADAISDFFLDEHHRELRRLIKPHAAGLQVELELLGGNVAEALETTKDRFDLVFPAGGSERFLTDLLRSAPLPVWVAGTTPIPPRRILAAIDGEDGGARKQQLNRLVLDRALSLARGLGATVEVVSVWTPGGGAARLAGSRAAGWPLGRREEDAAARVAALLDEAVKADPAVDLRPTVHLAGGNPAELLAETADARAIDLVVAGHAGRSGLPAWLLGNTAERLIHRLRCSILTVRAESGGESARAA